MKLLNSKPHFLSQKSRFSPLLQDRAFLRVLFVMSVLGLLAMMLAGCSASGDKSVLARDLPINPAAFTPLSVAPPRVGEYCVAYAARERAGRIANGKRLTAYDDWYTDVRKDYATP